MIQKLHFILLLLLLSATQLFSQGFARTYTLESTGNHGFSATRNAIETPGGNYIMIGLTHDTLSTIDNFYFYRLSGQYTTLSLLATDANGDVIWRKNYHSNTYNYTDNLGFTGALVKSSSGFYHAVSVKDNQGSTYGLLMKFDYNGDTLWQKRFVSAQPGGTLNLTAISTSVDGGLLLSAFTGTGLVTIKTTTNGVELWRHLLQSIPTSTQANTWIVPPIVHKIIQDTATKKIVHLVGYPVVSDSLGNSINTFTLDYSNSMTSILLDVIQTQDKNFVAVGYLSGSTYLESHPGPVPIYYPYIIKFSLSGARIWDMPDFTYVCYGGSEDYPCGYGAVSEKPNGEIVACGATYMKLSASGVKKYRRIFSLPRFCSNGSIGGNVMSIDRLASGSFILTKRGVSSFTNCPNPYMLVKIDDNGCDSTISYCNLVDDIKAQSNPDGFSMNLFPNPANDAVSIRLTAAGEKAMTISITNILDAEIEQLSVKTNSAVQLNTSNYNAGIYFIQAGFEGRVIETKRLMITR